MSYFVDVVRPLGYPHSRVFEDVALSFQHSLCEANLYDVNGRPIIFGCNLCPQYSIPLEPNAIACNLEVASSPWMTTAYLDLLRKHDVLDYSLDNVNWLRDRGVNAHWCPIRYHPHLTRLNMRPEAERDVDILFYGGFTPRRAKILAEVELWSRPKWRCRWLTHDQWEERDDAITRSKIILNLHAYQDAPLEMCRVSYLLANGAFVISEGPVEHAMREMLVFEPASQIATACHIWLQDAPLRAEVARRGQRQFQAMPQSAPLLAALEAISASSRV